MSAHRYGPPRRSRSWRRVTAVVAVVAGILVVSLLAVAVTGRSGTAPTGAPMQDPGGPGPARTTAPTRPPASSDAPARVAPPAEPLSASPPERIVVPTLGVDADVMDLDLTGDGALEVPQGASPAGWYTGSPTPGELGPAVVAGHVSWNGTPGVFHDLGDLRVGEGVEVVREDGSTARFVVSRTAAYDKDAFPTEAVYGDLDHAGLRLITCGGLDPASGVYEDNVVVFADLVAEV